MVDDESADELAASLWKIFPHLFRLIRWRKGINGRFSIYHYEVLGVLKDRGPRSMSDICRSIGVSKTNLTPIIDSLVDAGVVNRIPDEKDRRVVNAVLTTKGQDAMKQGKLHARQEMKMAFSSYSQGDLEELVSTFRKLAVLLAQLETEGVTV